VGVRIHDAFGDHVIGVSFQPPIRGAQPSLSSADRHQATGRSTSAFFLQTLPQSRVMIGFGDHALSRMESTLSSGGSGHGQKERRAMIHTSPLLPLPQTRKAHSSPA
jgi:hypothetical protein